MEDLYVLFLDDEKGIINALRRSLKHEPYKQLFTYTPDEALEALKGNEVAVIVSDISIPGYNVVDFLKQVNEEYPNVVKIALTGRNDFDDVYHIMDSVDLYKYVTKPWKSGNLMLYIIDGIEKYMVNKRSGLSH